MTEVDFEKLKSICDVIEQDSIQQEITKEFEKEILSERQKKIIRESDNGEFGD